MGKNELHDSLSLYSLGWLQNGGARNRSARKGFLNFYRGATWFISAPDTNAGIQLLEHIANAALVSTKVCCGMEVLKIHSEHTPEFGSRRVFRAASPVFIRGPHNAQNNKDPYLLFNDETADEMLTHTLEHKLEQAGLGKYAANVRVSFDRSFGAPKRGLSISTASPNAPVSARLSSRACPKRCALRGMWVRAT